MNTYEEAARSGFALAGVTCKKSLYRPSSKFEPAGVGVEGEYLGEAIRHAIPLNGISEEAVEGDFRRYAESRIKSIGLEAA